MNISNAYDHYYLYQEITDILKKYAEDYPDKVRLSSLAKTKEGRDVWLIEITDLSTGDFKDKPAYCLDANIHAGEVTGSMVAMYFLDTVMSNLDDASRRDAVRHSADFSGRLGVLSDHRRADSFGQPSVSIRG